MLIGGADVAALPPWKRDVGMVFQNYALWPHMSVAENVAFGLEERHWPRDRVRARVAEMLEPVDLAGYDARRPGQLPGGRQQRVAIARTLAIAPSVLLLDEPLSNLDAKLRASTGLELKRLQRRLGLATVFVTHDRQEAMTIADRLAVLDRGTIRQLGAPRELCALAVDGIGRAEIPVGRMPAGLAGAGAAVAVAFRPHALSPVAASATPGAGLVFDATIGSAEFPGEFVRCELAIGAHRALADLPAIAAIYAHHVRHGLATFEEEPPPADELARRRGDVLAAGLPCLVAEIDERVAGYAYASLYRTRSAYRFTLEDSVYVAPDATGRGLGRALLGALLPACGATGARQMIAVIGDSANRASIGLRAAFGFTHAGVLRSVGFKFGRWVDSVPMQRALGAGGTLLSR